MSERVTFFIDGTNLYFGLIKDLKRLDLDFQKLVQKLLNGRPYPGSIITPWCHPKSKLCCYLTTKATNGR